MTLSRAQAAADKLSRAHRTRRIALYERVSTDKQEFKSQHGALQAYCRRQGWRSPQIYEEKDSRSNAKRTVLNQLLINARQGHFDVVVVFRIDRLGSKPLHIYQVVEELKHLKIRFISLNDHIDTEDTTGKSDMLLGFMTTMAGNELHSIRERTKAGLAAARRSGKRVGRPPLAAEKIALVQQLGAQGRSYEQIARMAKISEASISRILQRDKKGGKMKLPTP